jgi:L-asparaginase
MELSERRVVLLTTGGTIATTGGASVPGDPVSRASRTGEDLLAGAAAFGPLPRVEVHEISRTPSWALDLEDMLEVVRTVFEASERADVDGVVVTHGTTTLEYTAFLSDLLVPNPVPVVFTGAMRRADVPDADGPRNLHDALRVAANPRVRGLGTLVCFNGRILSGRDAYKQHRSAVGTFTAVPGGVLGTIDDGVVDVRMAGRERPRFAMALESQVAVVKVHPGAGRAAVDAIVADGYKGFVVEALPGAGGVPRRMIPALADAVAAGVVVVVSSAAPHGPLPDPPTGGTGEVLLGLDLISARRLRTEKAWVLLAVALGAGSSTDEVRAAFQLVCPD